MFPTPNSDYEIEDAILLERWTATARAAAARARRRRSVLRHLSNIRDAAHKRMMGQMEVDTAMNRGKFVFSPRSKKEWTRAWKADAAAGRIRRMKATDERPIIAILRKRLKKATRRFF